MSIQRIFTYEVDPNDLVSKKNIFVNSLSFVLAKILNISVFIWAQQYLIRKIPSEEYAIYAIISSLVFLLPFITSSLVSAGSRYMVYEYSESNYIELNKVLSTSIILNFFISVFILILLLLTIYYLESLIKIDQLFLLDAKWMLFIISTTFIINFIFTPLGLGLYISQKLVLYNIMNLIIEILKIMLLFFLLFMISSKPLWIVVVNSLGIIFALITRIFLTKKIIPQLKFTFNNFEKNYISQFIKFGSWNGIILLSKYLRNFIALFMLNRFGTSLDVSNFNIGRFISRQTTQIWEPIRSSIGAPLITMHSKKEYKKINNTYLKGGRLAIWITSIIVFPSILFSNLIINFYVGPAYEDAIYITSALLAIIPFQMLNVMLPQISVAIDKQKTLALSMLFIQLTSIGFMYYTFVELGYSVIYMVFSIALINIFGELFLNTIYAKKYLKIKFKDILIKSLLPGIIPGMITSLYWMIIKMNFDFFTYYKLILCISPGFILLISLIYFCSLEEDKKFIKNLLSKVL